MLAWSPSRDEEWGTVQSGEANWGSQNATKQNKTKQEKTRPQKNTAVADMLTVIFTLDHVVHMLPKLRSSEQQPIRIVKP